MASQRENKVTEILLDGINSKPKCKAIKIHNSGYIESGTPDIIASINGLILLIEAKRDLTKKPSPIQDQRLKEWASSGAMTAVIKGTDQAKLFIKSIESVDLEAAIANTVLQTLNIPTQTTNVLN